MSIIFGECGRHPGNDRVSCSICQLEQFEKDNVNIKLPKPSKKLKEAIKNFTNNSKSKK